MTEEGRQLQQGSREAGGQANVGPDRGGASSAMGRITTLQAYKLNSNADWVLHWL